MSAQRKGGVYLLAARREGLPAAQPDLVLRSIGYGPAAVPRAIFRTEQARQMRHTGLKRPGALEKCCLKHLFPVMAERCVGADGRFSASAQAEETQQESNHYDNAHDVNDCIHDHAPYVLRVTIVRGCVICCARRRDVLL